MTNRVHIDAPAGIIDIKGEKEFVEGMLAKLFPLIEDAGFGSRPLSPANEQTIDDSQSASDEVRHRKATEKTPRAAQNANEASHRRGTPAQIEFWH